MGIIIIPTTTHGNAIKRTPEETHQVYARDATPYANLQYDKSLPFVPRYRYYRYITFCDWQMLISIRKLVVWNIFVQTILIHRYPVRQYYGKRSDGMFYGNHYNPTMYEEDSEWR